MAIQNASYCIDPRKTSTINFNLLPVSIGEIWSATDKLGPDGNNYCYTIIDGTDEPGSTFSAQTQYSNCDECLRANYTIVRITDCISELSYNVTYDSFVNEPIIGSIFNGSVRIPGKENSIISSCFTIIEFSQLSQNTYNLSLINRKFGVVTDVNEIFTTCTDCLTGSTTSYDVIRCTDGLIDCVGLIGFNSELVGHLISYSDGIDLYCGTVNKPSTTTCPFQYTFISDFGKDGKCEDCLSSGNTKLLLSDCLKPEITEIVWASALYNIGEASSLSTDRGCFTVVGPTEDPVTINFFLNFDPTPTCQQCIECNGFTISWIYCNNPEFGGSSTIYQYVSSGDFLWHPYYGCIEVTGVQQGDLGGDYIYGVETFSSCVDCQLNGDRILYEATACTSATTYVFNVSVPSTANPGETYQLFWGNIPFICVTLTQVVDIEGGFETGEYFTSNTQITCEECSTINIGIRAINCDTGQNYIFNLTQEDYTRHYYGKPKEFHVFKTGGQCYFIANSCPQEPIGTNPIITNYYDICYDCTPTNSPRSAGTESTICFICNDVISGETVTVVSPPHPVWTDSRGIAVTQLNAISLGGMNGLNS